MAKPKPKRVRDTMAQAHVDDAMDLLEYVESAAIDSDGTYDHQMYLLTKAQVHATLALQTTLDDLVELFAEVTTEGLVVYIGERVEVEQV